MAVDLSELVDSLKREVNPPGTDLFSTATDDEWVGNLTDAFWEAKLQGVFAGYVENAAARGGPTAFGEAIVTPTNAELGYDTTDDMPREQQQLVVLYAGFRILLNTFRNLKTQNRYKAGPVEYEVQQSATLLKGLLDTIRGRITTAMNSVLDAEGTNVSVLDAIIERSYQQAIGDVWWVR